MEEIKSMLHLDVMTVTGKTLGENLEELKKNGFYEHCDAILKEKSALIGKEIKRTDITLILTMRSVQREASQSCAATLHRRSSH